MTGATLYSAASAAYAARRRRLVWLEGFTRTWGGLPQSGLVRHGNLCKMSVVLGLLKNRKEDTRWTREAMKVD